MNRLTFCEVLSLLLVCLSRSFWGSFCCADSFSKMDRSVTTAQVFDAGGGSGRTNLTFSSLSEAQDRMYRRTIGNLSDMMQRNADQEQRQLKISEQLVKIRVLVCREDLPSIRGYIDIEYYPSAAQQVWGKFLTDVTKVLKIEFVHSILERGDKACVHRVLRLKDGGEYLVRQRESSAILEVLYSGKPPIENSWDITGQIIEAKNDLEIGFKNLPTVHNRIRHLVSQLLTSTLERETAEQIIACTQPIDVVSTISMIYIDNKEEVSPEELSLLALSTRFGDIAKFEGKIDIISLHRLCLEKLNRLAVDEDASKVVNQTMQYVFKVADQLLNEVDIIVIALRLLSDVMPLLTSYRDHCLKLIFKAMRHYAPSAPAHRAKSSNSATAVATRSNAVTTSMPSSQTYGGNPGPYLQQQSHSQPKHTQNRTSQQTQAIAKLGVMGNLSRYENKYFTSADKTRYQLQSQQVSSYIKTLEFDENLEVITPGQKNKADVVSAAGNELKESVAEVQPFRPVLIRGRERQDRDAAKQAMDAALHGGKPSSDHSTTVQRMPTPAHAANSSSEGKVSSSASNSTAADSLLTLQAKVSKESELPHINEIIPRQPKFKPSFRICERSRDSSSGSEDNRKAAWKGSVGELGR